MSSRRGRRSPSTGGRGSTSPHTSTPGSSSQGAVGFLPGLGGYTPPEQSPDPVHEDNVPSDSDIDDNSGTKKFILPVDGGHYDERNPTVKAIVNIVEATMVHVPFFTWKKIDPQTKAIMWGEFKKRYEWDPALESLMLATFDHVGGRRLKDLLYKARTSGKKPDWMGDNVWAAYLEHWSSPEFKAKSAIMKNNRASSKQGVVHRMGQLSYDDFKKLLAKKLGREPTRAEVFLYSRTGLDGKKPWPDQRSESLFKAVDEAIARESQSSDGSNTPVSMERINELFDEVAGGVYKGNEIGRGPTLPRRAMTSSSSSGSGVTAYVQTQSRLQYLEKENRERGAQMEKLSAQLEVVTQLLTQQAASQSSHPRPPPYPYTPASATSDPGQWAQWGPWGPPPIWAQQYAGAGHPGSASTALASFSQPSQVLLQRQTAPNFAHIQQQAGEGQSQFGDGDQQNPLGPDLTSEMHQWTQ